MIAPHHEGVARGLRVDPSVTISHRTRLYLAKALLGLDLEAGEVLDVVLLGVIWIDIVRLDVEIMKVRVIRICPTLYTEEDTVIVVATGGNCAAGEDTCDGQLALGGIPVQNGRIATSIAANGAGHFKIICVIGN